MASLCEGGNEPPGSLKAISNTESYPAFARIGLRENPGKNLNQVTCSEQDSNPGHLVSRPDALTVTPLLGHRPPVGVRTSAFRGPGRTAKAAHVELVPAARVRQHRAPGRAAARQLPSTGAQLHRSFSLPTGQHLGFPELFSRLIFSDEATFHTSGEINKHNCRVWGTQKPHRLIEHERDSAKVNVFCALSQRKLYGPFFFIEATVTGHVAAVVGAST
ncbi:hypothetical protein ANN_12525 [Periplaneta americana]|uniref:Uncharacterized protein n=1 Tax=Periplaneta americana TaxID=6978 RepID=A0ABQ8TGZ8_PERAM|nr:hypothetical protein ANN_12525 [Periplaneta americana]